MFCSIYKWYISRALDSGKPPSGPVGRHIRRCASCREFARFSESLENRCVKDVPGFLDSYNKELNEKIVSQVDVINEQTAVIDSQSATIEAQQAEIDSMKITLADVITRLNTLEQ